MNNSSISTLDFAVSMGQAISEATIDIESRILPSQQPRGASNNPELALWAEVLRGAVYEYLGVQRKRGGVLTNELKAGKYAEIAELWIDGEPGAAISFVDICSILDLDVEAVRAKLGEMKQRRNYIDKSAETLPALQQHRRRSFYR